MAPLRGSRIGRCLALVALSATAGCDFADPITSNPNTIDDPTLDQLLVSATAVVWGQTARAAWGPLWLQQLDGIGPVVGGFARYAVAEADASEPFTSTYGQGGLVDIRYARELAVGSGNRIYTGVFKVLEAMLVGGTTSLYGDIPYSEAATPGVDTPKLDAQRSVYDALQDLLDDAVIDLSSGEGFAPGAPDLFYGGDLGGWMALAYTLKARLHLHWAEVDGDPAYSAALAAAVSGVRDVNHGWVVDHTPELTERNPWYGASDIYVGGEFMVEALKARSDPRLALYFGEAMGASTGDFVGSHPDSPGDPGTDASRIACSAGFETGVFCPLGRGYGEWTFDLPGLTCAENYFIMAEAEYGLGNEGGAVQAADDALACEEERKGVDLSATRAAIAALSGGALFEEIMLQKYFSLFLSDEVWNDYKRTCLPGIKPYQDGQVPGRLLYPEASRVANPNIPDVDEQQAGDPHSRPFGANANDPDPCP